MKTTMCLIVMVLSGCAACRERPKTCAAVGVVGAFIVGTTIHDKNGNPHDVTVPTAPVCSQGVCK